MEKLNYKLIREAVKPGNASALTDVTRLTVAGGKQAMVAPAKYAIANSKESTYVFERRLGDDGPVNTVLIDSRTSSANRIELSLDLGMKEGQKTLSAMPTIQVTYNHNTPQEVTESDLTLPHRAFDAHVRLGFETDGKTSIIQNERYKAARNSTPANAWGLFDISPISVLFGCWDSTRKSHQARFASCLTGEIIGILADQEEEPRKLVTRRAGARIDPLGAKYEFTKEQMEDFRRRQSLAVQKSDKPSNHVIGAIPPSTGSAAGLDGIAVSSIVRSRVLSFPTLRSLCFGKGTDGDQAIKALLAALALNGIARADAELNLRANAHLVEMERPQILLYKRFGEVVELDAFSVDEANAVLDEAYENAEEAAGIDWHGQVFEVVGDPAVYQAASDGEGGE